MRSNDVDDSPAPPRVSVCVPMYNNSVSIARCLQSIVDQQGIEFEIVVVDDASPDGCAAIAATMLRSGDRLVSNGTRLGLNGNHNKCIELAHGDLIQFVHGDDWLLPGALQTLAACFDDPGVGLAFAPRRVLNADIPWWLRTLSKPHVFFVKLRAYNRGTSLVTQMMLMGAGSNWIGEPTSVMFRRQLALDVGCLRDDIYQLVDLDFWLRLMLRSAVCFVPQQLSVRNQSAATESARNTRTQRSWLDQLRILTWLIVDPASTNAIRISATGWWAVIWLLQFLMIAVFGPDRGLRLRSLTRAPVQEFARARRLRDRVSSLPT
ncbi:glycosyltransferase [Mycobacterium simiae]|uniref:Glycosyltransferase n=1 Tax=Mycobacterium simiae TaxID=1784 RepID=A0A5B1BVH7_MYCSI|nr:glycosyltransferase [Mycobacterium simiae]KAA1251982.1 glycosyltransferase [Mycobacterium simiae]